MKPALRPNARYEMIANMTNALSLVFTEAHIHINCLNCINFKVSEEICVLANLRPPAKVIAYGCPKWEDKDDIPF